MPTTCGSGRRSLLYSKTPTTDYRCRCSSHLASFRFESAFKLHRRAGEKELALPAEQATIDLSLQRQGTTRKRPTADRRLFLRKKSRNSGCYNVRFGSFSTEVANSAARPLPLRPESHGVLIAMGHYQKSEQRSARPKAPRS